MPCGSRRVAPDPLQRVDVRERSRAVRVQEGPNGASDRFGHISRVGTNPSMSHVVGIVAARRRLVDVVGSAVRMQVGGATCTLDFLASMSVLACDDRASMDFASGEAAAPVNLFGRQSG